MSRDKPYVSVIMPAYNAEKTVKACIDSLLKQTYENYEIIAVDNNSKDKTKEILQSYKGKIRFLTEEKQGSFAARNTGVRNSKGEILAFIDADCTAENNWLEKLTEQIRVEAEVAAYGGSVDVQETRWSRMEHLYEESIIEGFSKGNYIEIGDTKNLAITRRVFEDTGGFDESFEWSGDTDFGLRIVEQGYKIRLAEGAKVKHRFKATLGRIVRDKFRHGFWGVANYVKHKGSLKNYGRVLSEVKYGVYFLAISIMILMMGFLMNTVHQRILLIPSGVMLLCFIFMIIGANHTTIPILKKGLSDYNIYGLIHSTAWRMGALYYVLVNPSVLRKIP